MVSDSVKPLSCTKHVNAVLSMLGVIGSISSNFEAFEALVMDVTLSDASNHWMDCAGNGVEHLILVVSPI